MPGDDEVEHRRQGAAGARPNEVIGTTAVVQVHPKPAAPAETEAAIDALVSAASKALDDYAEFDQERIDTIVGKASVVALGRRSDLARLAVQETGCGVFEDKARRGVRPAGQGGTDHLERAGLAGRDR
ncbi:MULTISPECIES: hypothetical protein [unclassified Micromonospora]|uniref:hypothetical protein n=1 Tax=unclassified Micromonospora TaxID=2617518 RepID=UPI003A8B8E2D